MKSFLQSTPGRLLIKIAPTLLLIFLPIVPIWSAPVVLHPTSSLRWLSIWGILSLNILQLVGVTYHWSWYSYAILLALIALIVFIWLYPGRRTR